MVSWGKQDESLRTTQDFQLSSQESGRVVGRPRKNGVWTEQSAPMRGHPGPAFRDSQSGALRRGRTAIWGSDGGKRLERQMQEGDTAMENSQMVAHWCQARPRPVTLTRDTDFLALIPQSTAPHCCPATPPKVLCQPAETSLWQDPAQPSQSSSSRSCPSHSI